MQDQGFRWAETTALAQKHKLVFHAIEHDVPALLSAPFMMEHDKPAQFPNLFCFWRNSALPHTPQPFAKQIIKPVVNVKTTHSAPVLCLHSVFRYIDKT